MVGEELVAGLAVAMTAGLAAVALHETAETVRSYSPNRKKQKSVSRDRSYQTMIWG